MCDGLGRGDEACVGGEQGDSWGRGGGPLVAVGTVVVGLAHAAAAGGALHHHPATQVAPVQGALAKRPAKPVLAPTDTIREFGARRRKRVGGCAGGGGAAAGVLAGVTIYCGGDEVDVVPLNRRESKVVLAIGRVCRGKPIIRLACPPESGKAVDAVPCAGHTLVELLVGVRAVRPYPGVVDQLIASSKKNGCGAGQRQEFIHDGQGGGGRKEPTTTSTLAPCG